MEMHSTRDSGEMSLEGHSLPKRPASDSSTSAVASEDESLTSIAATLARADQALTLNNYIREFGIEPDELTARKKVFFLAARMLESVVDDLKIPMAEKRSSTPTSETIERIVEREVEFTRYREGEEKSELPSDQMDIQQIDSLAEITELLSSEWVLEEEVPDVFLRRLAGREALRKQWLERTRLEERATKVVKEKEMVEVPAEPEYEKQHAYVLIDRSASMDNYDGRDVAARGLALAFLRKGREQNSELNYQGFGGRVGTHHRGKGDEGLKELAMSILHDEPLHNYTDIQRALSHATNAMRQGGSFKHADILLITDGLSELHKSPLGKTRLHTFILGDDVRRFRYFDPADDPIRKLRKWSTTYREIGSTELLAATHVRLQDVEELSRSLPGLRQLKARVAEEADKQKLLETFATLKDTLEMYDLMLQENDARRPLQKLKEAFEQLEAELDPDELDVIANANLSRKLVEAERERRAALENDLGGLTQAIATPLSGEELAAQASESKALIEEARAEMQRHQAQQDDFIEDQVERRVEKQNNKAEQALEALSRAIADAEKEEAMERLQQAMKGAQANAASSESQSQSGQQSEVQEGGSGGQPGPQNQEQSKNEEERSKDQKERMTFFQYVRQLIQRAKDWITS